MDFANDTAGTREDMQNLENQVEKESGSIGLISNTVKTKIMTVKQCDDGAVGMWIEEK